MPMSEALIVPFASFLQILRLSMKVRDFLLSAVARRTRHTAQLAAPRLLAASMSDEFNPH